MITIVIADDHQLFRESLADLLSGNPGCRVIGLCQNSRHTIDMVCAKKPDVVLLDVNILPFKGPEAASTIRALSGSKVIGLSMYAHPAFAKKMIRAGAVGYITRNTPAHEIFTALTEVVKGRKFICAEIKNMISEGLFGDNDSKPDIALLNERELEIISLIKEGFTSRDIAPKFNVSLRTIETHRRNIMKKFQLKNPCSLVNFVYNNAGFMDWIHRPAMTHPILK